MTHKTSGAGFLPAPLKDLWGAITNDIEQSTVAPAARKLDVGRVTLSMALTWTLAYIVCVAFDLLFPQWEMHSAWQAWLPGFTWLSWGSFFLGLVEVFVITGFMGWLFAVAYNALGKRNG